MRPAHSRMRLLLDGRTFLAWMLSSTASFHLSSEVFYAHSYDMFGTCLCCCLCR